MSNISLDPSLAVTADQLGKCYRIYPSPRARLIQAFWGRKKKLYREFWALKNINIRLERGKTLGIVGRNGSGKSTLLQLLCGTLTPTTGSICVNGRVGALLELGSGFNPEFSGRENIYLNGAVLGLTEATINEKLDDILAFADIGEFVEQPVKTYSSGMAVRLAFAVQAHIDPDILVVDEALAVGDEMFQRKCYARLERLKQSGTSILLVTHSCPQIIQHCDQALLLHNGEMRMLGNPQRITTFYQQLANANDERWDQILPTHAAISSQEKASTASNQLDTSLKPTTTVIYPAKGIEIIDLTVEAIDGTKTNLISFGTGFQLRFRYRASQSIQEVHFGCHIADTTGQRISGGVYPTTPNKGECIKAGEEMEILFRFGKGLLPGTYFLGGGIWVSQGGGEFLHRVVDYRALKVLHTKAELLIGLCDLTDGAPRLTKEAELEPTTQDPRDQARTASDGIEHDA